MNPTDLIDNYKDILTGTKWKVFESDEREHDDSIIKFRVRGKRDALQAKVWDNKGESFGWYSAGVRTDGEVAFFSYFDAMWEGQVDPQGKYISFNVNETYSSGSTGYTNMIPPYTGAVLMEPI